MKETFYFSHDYNANQDPKMMAILNCCGLSGVGMYWILIEILHQQKESKILYKSYEDFIEFYGRLDGENEHLLNKIKQMLIDVELLIRDGDFVYSNRVLENKKYRELLSEKRSMAGKISADIRRKSTSVQQVSTSVQQGKERKGKEKKEKNIYIDTDNSIFLPVFKDFVEMRKRMRKPMTDKAQDLLMAKLKKMAGDDMDKAVKILEQSIMNSWLGIFPLKNENSDFDDKVEEIIRLKQSKSPGEEGLNNASFAVEALCQKDGIDFSKYYGRFNIK